jgi:threonylcarbamoyladenosine tRNA methylthiotransferase MtaB
MKIAFHTLGCKVNQYESEALQEKFKAKGHQIVAETDVADVYVINTCTVTGLADRKSRQFIRRLRKLNPDCILAVIGCYAQMQPEEIAALEGVNIVAGTNEKAGLVEIVEGYAIENGVDVHRKEYAELTEFEEIGMPVSMDARTRAYIKIQDGCNRFCAYCVVPYARGNIRSRSRLNILEEAEHLVEAGYKEIVLTGINTALYGAEQDDCRGNGLEQIISDLDQMQGDFRVRLSSLEPTVIDAALVGQLLQYKKLCPHFHLSLQSGSDRILKAMKRNYSSQDYMNIIQVLKDHDPGFAVTTDIIVGFPGETEEDFQDTSNLVQTAGFAKVHVFKYSKRSGTPAAEMTNQVDPAIKNQRSTMLLKIESEVGKRFLINQIGTKRRLLIEDFNGKTGLLSGYTENYIRVYLPNHLQETEPERLINSFMEVHLTGLYEDGMLAESAISGKQ